MIKKAIKYTMAALFIMDVAAYIIRKAKNEE